MIEVVAGDDAMPVAVGWHPWFRRTRGDMVVSLDADEHLAVDDSDVPTGAVSGETDLRNVAPLEGRRLDHTYIGAGATAEVVWEDVTMTMSFGETIAAVQVHTTPEGVCVEPQTSWPDAANLAARGVAGTGLATIAAGERFGATVVWRWPPTRS